MKKRVICMAGIAVCLLAASCKPAQPSQAQQGGPQQTAGPRPPVQQNQPRPMAPPPPPPQQQGGIGSEIQGVINYGTGATPVKAMQRSKSKINDINQQHNRQLDEALGY